MTKILIVDDQPEVRELVEVTLAADDQEIYHATSGEDAIEVARSVSPDLIIMDIMMPGNVDGLEATRRLKGDPATSGCKIIMLTAKGQQYDLDKGFEAGADDYFTKPFSPLALIRKIEKIIQVDTKESTP